MQSERSSDRGKPSINTQNSIMTVHEMCQMKWFHFVYGTQMGVATTVNAMDEAIESLNLHSQLDTILAWKIGVSFISAITRGLTYILLTRESMYKPSLEAVRGWYFQTIRNPQQDAE